MWSDSPEGKTLIEGLARDLLNDVAPEEMDMFDELAQDYFADASPPDFKKGPADDALGFGMGEMLTAATPALMAVASGVIGYIVQEVFQSAQQETIIAGLKALLRRRAEQTTAAAPSIRLTEAQLAHIRQIALQQAEAYGLGQAEAEQMVHALIGRLVLPS